MQKPLLLLFSFLVISFSLFTPQHCSAQNWLWGRQGKGAMKSNDGGGAVATDKYGNAYITSDYTSTITFGPFTLSNYYDGVYLVKYDKNGNVLWARQPVQKSGSDYSYSYSIAADSNGNTYITGAFIDTVTFGSYTLVSNGYYGSYTVFLVKYDPNGNVLWAKQSVGSGSYPFALAYSVAIDASDNPYITGYFYDTISFGSHTLYPSVPTTNAFTVKYDANGNVLWASSSVCPSSSSEVLPISVTADTKGNSYITGFFTDTVSFGAYTLYGHFAYSGYNDMFVVKYDANGNVLWAKQSVSPTISSNAMGTSVTTDDADNIYIAGGFTDTVTFGTYQFKGKGPGLFLVKYDGSGKVLWAEQSSRSGYYFSYSYPTLAHDANSHIYLYFGVDTSSLTFGGYTFACTSNTTYNTHAVSLAELDTSGKVSCASTFSNSYNYAPNGVTSDASGKYIYVAGTLYYDTLVFNKDTLLTQGGSQPYVARWQSCCTGLTSEIKGNNMVKAGESTLLTAYPAGATYTWSTGETSQSIIVNPTVSTMYTVTIYDSLSGCSGTAEFRVYIEDTIACGDLFVPTAFSPNNDGQNDIFLIKGNCINTLDLIIMDRWGNKVFEGESESEGWDGTYKGQAMNTGTYVYYLQATLNDGTSVEKKGNITLVR